MVFTEITASQRINHYMIYNGFQKWRKRATEVKKYKVILSSFTDQFSLEAI